MREIVFTMKDGSTRVFEHKGRPGGSYTIHLRYEGAFAVVVNEWGDETAIPASDISAIKTKAERHY